MLEGNIQKVTQVCGSSVGTDCLDGLAVKALIKPVVIVIFCHGGACNDTVIIKGLEGTDALIFLICQDSFQPGQRFMILEKGIKQYHCQDTEEYQNSA